MSQLNTKEKCTIRDLIKIEIKSLTKTGYGQYKYLECLNKATNGGVVRQALS